MEVVKSPYAHNQEDMLEVIDALRKEIEAGTVVAFAAVSVEADDQIASWIGTSRRVCE